MEVLIRQMKITDEKKVNELSFQLGYTITVEQTTKNIQAVLSNKDHNAFVAVHNDEVIGWIGLTYSFSLESPPHCEIRGLVVSDKYRGRGIGKKLIERTKQWTKERGVDKLRLRCNVKRKETHSFYEHLGFTEVKQQKVYEFLLI